MKNLYLAFLIILIGSTSTSQIVSWDFNGNTGSEVFVTAGYHDANLTASQITRGVVIATAVPDCYAATNWTLTNSVTTAISNNSYFQFSIKAHPGFLVSFSELNANFRRSASGPTNFQWQYSLNGINFINACNQITYTGTEVNGMAQTPINLSTLSPLQNLSDAVTITFRLYGFNAADAAGSFALGRLTADDLVVSGKIVPSVSLPVKLLNFSAISNGNITRLHWLVNCTSSSADFEIQRASSDYNFNTISSSTETQARCSQPFDVNDLNTPAGINFYRLKMSDPDGKIFYSKTIQVVNKKQTNSDIRIYPTVISNNATLTVPSDANYMAEIIILDNLGIQIEKIMAPVFKGINNIPLNLGEIPVGKYYIKTITGTEKNNTVVFIKQ